MWQCASFLTEMLSLTKCSTFCWSCFHFFISLSISFQPNTIDPWVIPDVSWRGWEGQRSSKRQKVQWNEAWKC